MDSQSSHLFSLSYIGVSGWHRVSPRRIPTWMVAVPVGVSLPFGFLSPEARPLQGGGFKFLEGFLAFVSTA